MAKPQPLSADYSPVVHPAGRRRLDRAWQIAILGWLATALSGPVGLISFPVWVSPALAVLSVIAFATAAVRYPDAHQWPEHGAEVLTPWEVTDGPDGAKPSALARVVLGGLLMWLLLVLFGLFACVLAVAWGPRWNPIVLLIIIVAFGAPLYLGAHAGSRLSNILASFMCRPNRVVARVARHCIVVSLSVVALVAMVAMPVLVFKSEWWLPALATAIAPVAMAAVVAKNAIAGIADLLPRKARATSYRTELDPGKSKTLKIAHWSDLHITSTDDTPCIEGQRGMRKTLSRLISRYREELIAVDAVVITGDVTDSGKGEEWRSFFSVLDTLEPDVRAKVVLIPGNHDLNIVDGHNFFLAEEASNPRRRARIIRMMAAMDRIQGERAWVFDEHRRRVRLREHMRRIARLLNDSLYAAENHQVRWGSKSVGMFFIAEHVFNDMFPMVVEVKESDQLSLEVVCFDSNGSHGNVVTNALGSIPSEALRRLEVLHSSSEWSQAPKIYALHHHVCVPSDPLRLEPIPVGPPRAR